MTLDNPMILPSLITFFFHNYKRFLQLTFIALIHYHRLTCRALAKWRERNLRADNTSAIVVFFDEYEKQVAPYILYTPLSDAETELGEEIPNLSRSNSSVETTNNEEVQLKREDAVVGLTALLERNNKRQNSSNIDNETEREIKRIILNDD